ncbi:MAG: hypothetical protein SD837_05900 [Candidatus Electrothrix scaldis]|nr:MAG: hypothetical protein SD837_05900 [Candidatus Electrothrix sp. GW3-3]
MKLADTNSRLGKKLGKWLPRGEEEGETDESNSSAQEPIKKRHDFSPLEFPITPLEKRIRQWFTAEEQGDRPLIIRERGGRRFKILVITYHRAILFEAGPFKKLHDISDKTWRQFISVHLSEGTFLSTLKLSFFQYDDSLFYHNPYKDASPYMEETGFKAEPWQLNRLSKKEAQRIYTFLKDKELYWKEKRRQEHLEFLNSLNAKAPGGPPQKK